MQYLFDSSGNWIAFRVGRYVYDTNGQWIGWLPWDDVTVITTTGEYLGTIFPGNRLYRRINEPYRGYPGYPGYPGYAGYSPLPPMTSDVVIEK
jgi:hypothetical protein